MTAIDNESHFRSPFMINDPHVPLAPLSALQIGEIGQVHSIAGTSEFVRRLAELGLSSGARIEMLRPGSTCILRINDAKLCVRSDELLQVMIAPLPLTTRHSA